MAILYRERMPGDGEASLLGDENEDEDFPEDCEDDIVDNLDDDFVGGSDGMSIIIQALFT
ncbi:hypothetical protein DPMN_060231 [Dreissena polymorpha]|uniref:Uncharacterized protein n=1 Tax=Dreissena polymorpha TaxID=45954 RepID=A0A9D4C4V3_DREPO|nr:hypothetical protein DPMN_060231 [Dreissena polymorpha]